MRIITSTILDKIETELKKERAAGRVPKAVELTQEEFDELKKCAPLGLTADLWRSTLFGLSINVVPTPVVNPIYSPNVFPPRKYEYTNDGGF